MAEPTLKKRLWWRFLELIKYPAGQVYSLPLKILHAIIFPLKTLVYSFEHREGYQWDSDTWIIHGMKYSDDMFKHFAFGSDETFKIIEREDGLITIQKINI